ncbi:MAG: hypothetical protein NTZ78_15000 [Candidatus Aureabacteria bacterium]|nr:hypothetical protein [Candidatus Auribacterota bacterium]
MSENRHPQKDVGIVNMFAVTLAIGMLLAIGISYLHVSNECIAKVVVCQIAGIRG